MSESDTRFNERDQRCAAVQLMLSTDPSYDNRSIASTLKMQIQTVQLLEMVERKPKAENTSRKTRTKEFIEKVQAIIDETPHVAYSVDCQRFRHLTHNCECMFEGGLEV